MEPKKTIDLDEIARAIDIYTGCGPRRCEDCYALFDSDGCPQTYAMEILIEVGILINTYLNKSDTQNSISQDDFIKLLQGELP